MKAANLSLILLAVSLGMAHASLAVKVAEPKVTGNKALIQLTLKNTFKEKVESARAAVFLFDEKGKMVGQSTAWVIGGTKDKPALAPDASTDYFVAVPADKPFKTIQVVITKLVLEGG